MCSNTAHQVGISDIFPNDYLIRGLEISFAVKTPSACAVLWHMTGLLLQKNKRKDEKRDLFVL